MNTRKRKHKSPYSRKPKPCRKYESAQEPEHPHSVCYHCGHLRAVHK